MNKVELVAKMAEKSGLSKSDAQNALNAFIESVSESLAQGDSVSLIGHGTYLVRERSPREGRNPRTGETIHISGGNFPAFKPGKSLKEAVK